MYCSHLIVSLQANGEIAKMKRLPYIIILLLVLCALSCTRTSRHPQLVAVDSLLQEHPDSALQVLLSLKGEVGGMGRQGAGLNLSSKADRMYYYLLLADACNKCYDTLPSDSILREVADFYDSHGTPNEQVRAHYLLGCAYRDMGEAPQALDCYHDAIDRADTTASDCNYRLLMSVYGQMAELFHKQNLPQDEIEALRMSGHYDLLNHDTIGYIRSMELMLKPYGIMGDTVKVLDYINKSQQLYREHGYPFMAIRENSILIYYAIERGQLERARALMQEFEKESRLFDDEGNIAKGREAYYYIKGAFFMKNNQLDSSIYYMRKLLASGNETDAYRGLLTVYQQKGYSDSVMKYASLYEEALDTLSNRKRTETVHQMSAMYNYHRFQKKAEAEERTSIRLRWTMGIIVVFVFTGLLIFFYLYRRYKQRKLREITILHTHYAQALAAYKKQEEELELLKSDSQTFQYKREQELHRLQETVIGYQEKLQALQIEDDADELLNHYLVRKFHEKATGKKGTSLPIQKEWKELIRLFKKNMPINSVIYCKKGLLSQMELQTYILLMLEFTDGESAVLQDTSPQSINNAKARINKKLFNDNSSASLLSNLKYLSAKV